IFRNGRRNSADNRRNYLMRRLGTVPGPYTQEGYRCDLRDFRFVVSQALPRPVLSRWRAIRLSDKVLVSRPRNSFWAFTSGESGAKCFRSTARQPALRRAQAATPRRAALEQATSWAAAAAPACRQWAAW